MDQPVGFIKAAIHATDGYARATGKIGVAYLPPNSAITNAITGILTAQMDSAPLVIIVVHNDQRNDDVGMDDFKMTIPITNYMRIEGISEIHHSIMRAFHIAGEGRPGNVVVEIDQSVLEQQTR